MLEPKDIGWKVGGAQGEGIDSTGDIFSLGMHRLGYYVNTYRHFMSLIKGGHTNYKVRVASKLVRYHGDVVHILIAFDQGTIDYNAHELVDGSVVVFDSAFDGKLPESCTKNVTMLGVPLTGFAKDLGNPIMKNMVATGVSLALLGLAPADVQGLIQEKFGGKKGAEVAEANLKAVQMGFDFANEHVGQQFILPLRPALAPAETPRMLISGNESTALGGLAGGMRMHFAYPITPATEIIYTSTQFINEFGGAFVQFEDEIGACNAAIGANYAGVRSWTTTSGPGLSLMQEAIGLAGISETPLVIVDVMRGGPGTGLPTKVEQSDINEAVYGSHGEIPRVVLYPATVEEAFFAAAESFNLAEKYQTPVILLTDLVMGMNDLSVEYLPLEKVQIDRGALLPAGTEAPADFLRYEPTASGVSRRSIPTVKGGSYTALSNEHDRTGREEVEDQASRLEQMGKRMRKLQPLIDDATGAFTYEGPEDADLLVIAAGSTLGAVSEAIDELTFETGAKVAHLHLRRLYPLPAVLTDVLARGKKLVTVEHSYTGQIAGLLRRELHTGREIKTVLKYDGDPFTVREIVKSLKEVL